jgi:hypothetical protein
MAALVLPLFLGAVALGASTSTEPEPVPAYPTQPPAINPVYQRAAENQIAGRYDNVPMLQSVYRDPAYTLDPGVVGKMDFEGPLREPNVTPLGLGVLPAVHRGTGVMLPDPITGDDLKPQKRENRDVDMFMPQGAPVKGRYEFSHLQPDMRIRQLETKSQGGHGALDGFTHIPDNSGRDATRNFAKGEVMTVREGGFHPRQRLFRVDELNRNRTKVCGRMGNPSQAIGKLGSIYQTSTAPLGELQLNPNADVAEWYRPPEHSRGARSAPLAEGITVMKAVNRETGLEYNPDPFCTSTEQSHMNPAGPVFGAAQEARRLLNRYVRPKEENSACIGGLQEGTDRGTYVNALGDFRHNNAVCVEGRPSGPNRPVNEVADGASAVRFYDVRPRDADKKETGMCIEAIHAPNTTRSMAMQRSAPEEFANRRVTPFIEQQPGHDLIQNFINNPYTQPLPHVPRQQ